MKLPVRNQSGETESLGEYCVRAFSEEQGSSEQISIPLYSGVPVLNGGAKKKPKAGRAADVTRGKVIT